jgi:EAL domain-containing protein (putative c-di-GMP-specific phosphodiesterase class I)
LRWRRPKQGLVLPADFIAAAEDTGLIVPLGEWVLRTACAQAQRWQDAGLPARRIAVNISARQFLQPDLAGMIAGILEETNLDPGLLELEITETVAMKNADYTLEVLRHLRQMGIRISIDDFGTGYSSLTYLKNFPIQTVKIDQSFVRDLASDQNDAALAIAIINMAHVLGLNVVAEGVETGEQLAFLAQHRCDEYQGYLLARPAPPEELATILERDVKGATGNGRRGGRVAAGRGP